MNDPLLREVLDYVNEIWGGGGGPPELTGTFRKGSVRARSSQVWLAQLNQLAHLVRNELTLAARHGKYEDEIDIVISWGGEA